MKARRFVNLILPPLVPFVMIVAVLEIGVRTGAIPAFLLPRPSGVFVELFDHASLFARALGQTAWAAVGGFLLSTVVGIGVAVLLSAGGWVQRAFYPYAVFFQTVPIIAIAPLLIIWFGYDYAMLAASFVVSIFPIIANTLSGLLSVDPSLRDLFRLYGAGPVASLFKLRLPHALPSIFTGLRIGSGLAVIGAVAGEFVTNTGIGGQMITDKTGRRIDAVFASLLLASLLGIAMFGIINLLSYFALRHWHASEKRD